MTHDKAQRTELSNKLAQQIARDEATRLAADDADLVAAAFVLRRKLDDWRRRRTACGSIGDDPANILRQFKFKEIT